jgi:8-oxo-dGTP pyrophosphatase MutT (NUDIX family)
MTEYEMIRRQLDVRLAPLHSLKIEPERVPQAAVTLILHSEEGSAQFLLIKRAERADDHWSGQLALPGGRVDPMGDADLVATAVRETREEVGIDLLKGGRFIGQLPLIKPNNPRLPRIEITPFVVVALSSFSIQLNAEVASAFWVSVDRLKQEGRSNEYRMDLGSAINSWPAYPSEAGPIWGITERILTSFLDLLD